MAALAAECRIEGTTNAGDTSTVLQLVAPADRKLTLNRITLGFRGFPASKDTCSLSVERQTGGEWQNGAMHPERIAVYRCPTCGAVNGGNAMTTEHPHATYRTGLVHDAETVEVVGSHEDVPVGSVPFTHEYSDTDTIALEPADILGIRLTTQTPVPYYLAIEFDEHVI